MRNTGPYLVREQNPFLKNILWEATASLRVTSELSLPHLLYLRELSIILENGNSSLETEGNSSLSECGGLQENRTFRLACKVQIREFRPSSNQIGANWLFCQLATSFITNLFVPRTCWAPSWCQMWCWTNGPLSLNMTEWVSVLNVAFCCFLCLLLGQIPHQIIVPWGVSFCSWRRTEEQPKEKVFEQVIYTVSLWASPWPHTALGRGYMFIDQNVSAYKDPGHHQIQRFHLTDEDTEAQRRKQPCSRLYRKFRSTSALQGCLLYQPGTETTNEIWLWAGTIWDTYEEERWTETTLPKKLYLKKQNQWVT